MSTIAGNQTGTSMPRFGSPAAGGGITKKTLILPWSLTTIRTSVLPLAHEQV
jgi:hypothetical protein